MEVLDPGTSKNGNFRDTSQLESLLPIGVDVAAAGLNAKMYNIAPQNSLAKLNILPR